MNNHNVGDLVLYVLTIPDRPKIYQLGMVSKIVKDIGDANIKYLIEWADDRKNVDREHNRYSNHIIETYKEWLQIYMGEKEPDRESKQ